MTELLSPFKDSLSHFKNSCEGAAGGSSTLSNDTGLEAAIDLAAAGPLGRTEDNEPEVPRDEIEGVKEGRTSPSGAADAFPVAPTVVHALPPVCIDDVMVLYLASEKFAQLPFLRTH